MERRQAGLNGFLFLSFLVLLFLSLRIASNYKHPFPPLNELVFDTSKDFERRVSTERPLGAEGGYRDLGGVMFGLRRLTADIAWISVLQYYGAHEAEEGAEAHHDFGGGNYPALKKLVTRVIRLDPSFHYAYLYGSGALAFNLNRPEEALQILEEGIRSNPTYWRFRLYLGAILFKQKGRFNEMVKLLEDAVSYPDCPTLLKSILGNIYEENGRFSEALRVWIDVYEHPQTDSWYRSKAERRIAELRARLGL